MVNSLLTRPSRPGAAHPAAPLTTGVRPGGDDGRMTFTAGRRRNSWVQPLQNYAVGGQVIFQVPATGLGRWFTVNISLPITLTAPATPSPKAPWNLFTRCRFFDAEGILRVDASVYSLYLLKILKRRTEPGNPDPYGRSTSTPTPQFQGLPSYESMRYNVPTAAGAGTMVASFDIPLALDYNDPRGAPWLEVPNSKARIEVDCAPQLWVSNTPATTDAPYSGGAGGAVATAGAATVSGQLYYWDRPIAADPAQWTPSIRATLPHEVRSINDSTNMLPSMEKQFILPADGVYYRVLESINENGTLALNHLTRFRLLAGNDPQMDELIQSFLNRAHDELDRDTQDGFAYWDIASYPYNTSHYGQIAVDTTFASNFNNAGNTYTEFLFDLLATHGAG